MQRCRTAHRRPLVSPVLKVMTQPKLSILLARPRGFCAGVDRAIHIVERAIALFGPPVYVRHEIVHNRHVVSTLEAKGAIFVDELDQVPDGRPVIFSAHGVPKSVPAEAARRGLTAIDATCPLVTKVHLEASSHARQGRQIVMIGHAGHPEVVGTMGQVPEGAIMLVETVEDADRIAPDAPERLAYITQTTLSVDDTARIVERLRQRFPAIHGPRREDICYATTNRQLAVKTIAPRCDALLVVGAPNSSNSRRLVEVAERNGCPRAILVQNAAEIDWTEIAAIRRLGISAGASAPETLVEEILDACRARFQIAIEEVAVAEETVTFKLPASLGDA